MIKRSTIFSFIYGLLFISFVHAGLKVSKPAPPPPKPFLTVALMITICKQKEENTPLYAHTHTYAIYPKFIAERLPDTAPQTPNAHDLETKLLKIFMDESKINERTWRASFQKITLQYSLLKKAESDAAALKTEPKKMDINLWQTAPHTQIITCGDESFIMKIKQMVNF